jgi:hypothetical protein
MHGRNTIASLFWYSLVQAPDFWIPDIFGARCSVVVKAVGWKIAGSRPDEVNSLFQFT